MKTVKHIQQGDVIFKPVNSLPNNLELQTNTVVQEGEHTGHAHRLDQGEVFFEKQTNKKYLRLVEPTYIRHEEHAPIKLPAGMYEIGIVREKGMFNDLVAPVVD